MKFKAAKLRKWLGEFKDYADYRQQVLMTKQAMPDRTMQLLGEEEFNKIREGEYVEEQRNYEEHESLKRQVSALNSRFDGAFGHLYGAENHPGVLDRIEDELKEMNRRYEKLDGKIDAFMVKEVDDIAHIETTVAKLQTDVQYGWKKIKDRESVGKLFRNVAIGASVPAMLGAIFVAVKNWLAEIAERIITSGG